MCIEKLQIYIVSLCPEHNVFSVYKSGFFHLEITQRSKFKAYSYVKQCAC